MTAQKFVIRRVDDPAVIRAYLSDDRRLAAYALGDLDPAHWPLSEFVGAYRGDQLAAIVLWYHGLQPVILTPFGDPDAVQAILERSDLPGEIYYVCTPDLGDRLGMFYERASEHREWRMVADADSARQHPQVAQIAQHVTRIKPAQASELSALYQFAAGPGEEIVAFSPAQIASGVFFGVWREGSLVATSGTHVYSPDEGICAIGNVFTHPDWRGHGFATECTAAVVHTALAANIATVVLNVRQENAPAIHIYEKLGFRRYTILLEGPALLRNSAGETPG